MTIIEKKRTIVWIMISQAVMYVLLNEKNKPLSNLPDMFTSLIPLYSSLTKVDSQVYVRILCVWNRYTSWRLNLMMVSNTGLKHVPASVLGIYLSRIPEQIYKCYAPSI